MRGYYLGAVTAFIKPSQQIIAKLESLSVPEKLSVPLMDCLVYPGRGFEWYRKAPQIELSQSDGQIEATIPGVELVTREKTALDAVARIYFELSRNFMIESAEHVAPEDLEAFFSQRDFTRSNSQPTMVNLGLWSNEYWKRREIKSDYVTYDTWAGKVVKVSWDELIRHKPRSFFEENKLLKVETLRGGVDRRLLEAPDGSVITEIFIEKCENGFPLRELGKIEPYIIPERQPIRSTNTPLTDDEDGPSVQCIEGGANLRNFVDCFIIDWALEE